MIFFDDKKTYGQYRKSVYASINGTKGNMVNLSKSKLLNKEEKKSCLKVIEALEEFRITFYNSNPNNKKK